MLSGVLSQVILEDRTHCRVAQTSKSMSAPPAEKPFPTVVPSEAKDLDLLVSNGILQMLRGVYPERVTCKPFASLRVTAKG